MSVVTAAPRAGRRQADHGPITDAAIACEGETIVAVGKTDDVHISVLVIIPFSGPGIAGRRIFIEQVQAGFSVFVQVQVARLNIHVTPAVKS